MFLVDRYSMYLNSKEPNSNVGLFKNYITKEQIEDKLESNLSNKSKQEKAKLEKKPVKEDSNTMQKHLLN